MSAAKMISLGRGVPEIARSYLLKNKGFIGGGWVPSSSGRTFPVLNPANQELISEVADMSPQDVKLAVHEAKGAMKQWSSMVPKVNRKEVQSVISEDVFDVFIGRISCRREPVYCSNGRS